MNKEETDRVRLLGDAAMILGRARLKYLASGAPPENWLKFCEKTSQLLSPGLMEDWERLLKW